MLTKKIEKSFKIKGVRVNLTLAFNNILKFYELQEDERFTNTEKVEIGFDLICNTKKKIDFNEKVEVIQYVFEHYVNIVKLKGPSNDKKVIDFLFDSGFIYASFMKEYNIDLNDCIDVLDWRKFIWLFHGLSEKSKIKEIMNIRGRELPKATKHNKAEIEHILTLKTMYALETTEEERGKNLAKALMKIAKRYT